MGGLWEEYDVMEVASPQAWDRNPELVLRFYNERRKKLFEAKPNYGHIGLVELEDYFDVHIITQNVDDLHERAGSKKVLHLHGELRKTTRTSNPSLVDEFDHWELKLGDTCERGSQWGTHIVWFGEEVPLLEKAAEITLQADILVIVGTSMQVYPAASLINYTKPNIPIYFIDPKPSISENQYHNLTVIKDVASSGTEKLIKLLRK